MSKLDKLLSPARLGSIDTENRVLMAPLTRSRADQLGVPSDMATTYYEQRAGAGLIITEATQVDPMGKGYDKTPGIHSQDQVRAWRKVTEAVHAKGGKIVLQLWHVGRISHTSILPLGQSPVAPSGIQANAQTFANGEFIQTSVPRALETDEIKDVIAQFVHGAKMAKEAGFDGVEVHAANGYLLEQFIMDGTNQRSDSYGGSAENRGRLVLEVTEAVAGIWGADKVGIRLSPTSSFNDMSDSDRLATFTPLYQQLNQLDLAYLHVVEQFPGMEVSEDDKRILSELRNLWSGAYIANGGFDAHTAQTAIESGHATAVTFGRPYIANPDLVERFENGWPLAEPDPDTMYGGEAGGYIDYPVYRV